ncbi:MAG: ATP-binding protein [Patescibacteria group bacterium]|nr:ATP-binding protein [Patescibacteria group bacterium]
MELPKSARALRDYGEQLETLVAARTEALTEANEELERAVHCLEEEIAKRWQAEASLRDSEREKAAILNGMAGVSVTHVDLDMRILWINGVMRDRLCLPLDAIQGQHCYKIVRGSDVPCAGCAVAAAIKTGETQRGEMTFADGSTWLICSNPIQQEDGHVSSVVHTALDISERKQVEKQLEQTAGNLKRANETLLAASARAEAANRAKSAFLANMSHEIRTPMTAIMGFADLLREQVDAPDVLEAVDTMKRNGDHLLSVIGDILDLADLEAGHLPTERVRCSPVEIANDVLRAMQPRADAKSLALACHYRRPMPAAICTDPARLRQILSNLVGNAIKFTETGGVRVMVRLEPSGNESRICFEVIDTGAGIAEQHLPHLFEPFFRGDESTVRRHGGSGLGLPIARRLAKALGGELCMRSRPGDGSTFTLVLPCGDLHGVAMLDGLSRNTVVESRNGPAAALEGRVLLVEDGLDNQRLLRLILHKAGAKVTIAENGRKAIELALPNHDVTTPAETPNPFDLILMDMQMPVMDGYEATQELRRQGYAGPILALTAHAMSHDRQKCLDAGCDEFITKPIDRAEFLETIAQYLPVSSRRSPPG